MQKFIQFILSETGMKIVVGLVIIWMVSAFIIGRVRITTLKHYKKVQIGMSEEEMLSVMGGNPSVSNFQHKKKFEWFIKGTSSTYYNNGIASTMHNPKKSVVITTENGKVTAIVPNNI